MALSPPAELLSNIFRVELFDTLTQATSLRLANILKDEEDLDNIEIEGKFGRLLDASQNRFQINGIDSGTVLLSHLTAGAPYRFDNGIPEHVFIHLRDVVLSGRWNNYSTFQTDPSIRFIATHTIDEFYRSADGNTIRVSRNHDTKEILECICKQETTSKHGPHMNFLCNSDSIDFRITTKRELSSELPTSDQSPFMIREKIRSSFLIGMWSIDLTELPERSPQTGQVTRKYEMEVELQPGCLPLVKQAIDDYLSGRNANLQKIVRVLINTLQTLQLYSDPRVPVPPLCQLEPLSNRTSKRMKQFDQSHSAQLVALAKEGLGGESRI